MRKRNRHGIKRFVAEVNVIGNKLKITSPQAGINHWIEVTPELKVMLGSKTKILCNAHLKKGVLHLDSAIVGVDDARPE